jgi:Fe-S-cluster containining protein
MSERASNTLPPVDWAMPPDEPLAEVERQMERGSQFTQAALREVIERLSTVEANLTKVVGFLSGSEAESGEDGSEAALVGAPADAAGAASAEEPGAGEGDRDEEIEGLSSQMRATWPAIALATEPEGAEPRVEVNCDERMHICHAVCCKLNFALTAEEVESGKVKWDLGFPYFIRHGSNSYCSHNDTATGRCNVYADRPGVCRRYSCAHDTRIWKDFDNMVLNEEWIRENLAERGRIVIRAPLPLMDVKHGGGASANGSASACCGNGQAQE